MHVLDPDNMPPLIGTEGEPVNVDDPEAYWSYGTIAPSGKTVYISGQVGWDENGDVVGGDNIVKQTEQTLENFGKVLNAAEGEPKDVAKVTAYVTDMDEAFKIAEVRSEFFGDHTPASTIVEIEELYMKDLMVEIEGIAVIEE